MIEKALLDQPRAIYICCIGQGAPLEAAQRQRWAATLQACPIGAGTTEVGRARVLGSPSTHASTGWVSGAASRPDYAVLRRGPPGHLMTGLSAMNSVRFCIRLCRVS
jgi:hypothetical protein